MSNDDEFTLLPTESSPSFRLSEMKRDPGEYPSINNFDEQAPDKLRLEPCVFDGDVWVAGLAERKDGE